MQKDRPSNGTAKPDPPITEEENSVRVDGDALVLPSGCTMPMVCVKTNRPVTEKDMVFTNLYWCPLWVAGLVLLSGCLLIIVYFLVRKECAITFGLDPNIRAKKVIATIVKIVLAIAMLGTSIALAISDSVHWIIEPLSFTAFALFLIFVALVFLGNSPLRAVNYHDGMFWVKGFSPDYLRELQL